MNLVLRTRFSFDHLGILCYFPKNILHDFDPHFDNDLKLQVGRFLSGKIRKLSKGGFYSEGIVSVHHISQRPTDEPNRFPHLEILKLIYSKGLKYCHIRTWSCSEGSNSKMFRKIIWFICLEIWQTL